MKPILPAVSMASQSAERRQKAFLIPSGLMRVLQRSTWTPYRVSTAALIWRLLERGSHAKTSVLWSSMQRIALSVLIGNLMMECASVRGTIATAALRTYLGSRASRRVRGSRKVQLVRILRPVLESTPRRVALRAPSAFLTTATASNRVSEWMSEWVSEYVNMLK